MKLKRVDTLSDKAMGSMLTEQAVLFHTPFSLSSSVCFIDCSQFSRYNACQA